MSLHAKTLQRFWNKVTKLPGDSCWVWNGARCRSGGRFWNGKRIVQASHFAWEQEHGSVPQGIECDPLCRNPFCVRPSHHELKTHAANMQSHENIASTINACKEHCPKCGSDYNHQPDGSRICTKCVAARDHAKWRANNPEPTPRTVCDAGHPLTDDENCVAYFLKRNWRLCRTCAIERSRKHNENNRKAA